MTGDAPYYVYHASQLADLDLDGDLDFVGTADSGFAWVENLGGGQFATRWPVNYGGPASGTPVDLDRDGDIDFVPARSNFWMENTGGFVYAKRYFPTINGDTFTSRLVTDLDHDGNIDIVGNSGSQTRLAWLHNNGDRTFIGHSTSYYLDLQLATALVVGDVDGDGYIDIVNTPEPQFGTARGGYWYKNDGAGNFTQKFFYTDAAQYALQAAYLADLDADGDLDVIGTTSIIGGQYAATWYHNVSTGLTIAVNPAVVSESSALGLTYTFHRVDSAAKDLTVNFAVAGSATYGMDYSLSGAATFSATGGTVVFPAGADTVQVNILPLDDHLLESSETIAVSIAPGDDYVAEGNATATGTITDDEPGDFGDAPGPYPTTLSRNGARHSAAGPTLGLLRDEEAEGQPSAGAAGDNLAGLPDEDGVQIGTIRVGQTRASAIVHVAGAPVDAYLDAWIDFNGDGNWDAALERISEHELMHNSDNTIVFDVPSSAVAGQTYARFRLSSAGGLSPYGAAPDGEVEDYAVIIDSPRATSATFAPKEALAMNAYADNVAAADLDGDGDIDLVGTSDGNRYFAWYENDGLGGFTRHAIDTTADGPALAAADIDGDGDVDIVAIVGSYDIREYLNDGHGNFVASPVNYTGPSGPLDLMAADLDADGDMDLIVSAGQYGSDLIEWLENRGSEGFAEHFITDKTGSIDSIDVADLDGDGDLDLVTASPWGTDNGLRWYENNGHAQFSCYTLSSGNSPSSAKAADIDHDGDIDILSAGSNGLLAYLNDGNANFVQQTITSTFTNGVSIGDLDGDGDLDLIANVGGSSRTLLRQHQFRIDGTGAFVLGKEPVYLNDGTAAFTSTNIESGTWVGYRDPTIADLNGDGALDLVSPGTLYWYRNIAPIPGDFNQDQLVDGMDYIVWRKSQGSTVAKFTGADANGDAADSSLSTGDASDPSIAAGDSGGA